VKIGKSIDGQNYLSYKLWYGSCSGIM